MKIYTCCGKSPKYIHYQATEDTCEGYFKCAICGKEGDVAENTMGGEDLMILAVDCWNELFEVE